MAGSLTVSGTQTGVPLGNRVIGPLTITMGTTGQTTDVVLASGPNTITVPTTAVAVIIIPPAGNTVALTLKGVTGDTGVPIHPTSPTGPIPFPAAPPASFVITAASLTSSSTEVIFV